MRHVEIIDQTLKNAPRELSFRERLELTRLLVQMHPDCIEAGDIQNERADGVFLRSAAQEMGDIALAVACTTAESDIDRAWAAVSAARRPRLIVCVPASAVRMEYREHKKAPQMLEAAELAAKHACALCADCEIALEDATRAERAFLLSVLRAGAEAGVQRFTLADDAGVLLPDEAKDFMASLKADAPAGVKLFWQGADEMRMAVACAFSALLAGADGVKTALRGMNLPQTRWLARALSQRGDACGLESGLRFTQLQRAADRAEQLLSSRRASSTPFDAGARDAAREDIVLDASAAREQVAAVIRDSGYALSPEDEARVYEAFRRVSEKKPVTMREMDAIIASAAMQAPPAYRLKSYHVNASNIIAPTAHVVLEKDGREAQGLSVGDGPIDAAFLAIEQIAGRHFELDDFQIQALTEGRGAMGDALVKLRHNGRLFAGKGLSTDIIGASIRAYLSALNKIAFEENDS